MVNQDIDRDIVAFSANGGGADETDAEPVGCWMGDGETGDLVCGLWLMENSCLRDSDTMSEEVM